VQRGWSHFFRQLRHRRLAVVLAIYFLFVFSFSIMTTDFTYFTMYRFDYDATHNGYLFAYIGILAAVVQGALIGRLVKRYGELPLVLVGALLLTAGLVVLPFVGPAAGGLLGLLGVMTAFSFGNSFATPTLTSLASKSVGAAEQGGVMGATQSAASLARTVGPTIGGWLIYSSVAPGHIDDRSLRVTFWVAAGVMFAAFLLSAYLMRESSGRWSVAGEGQNAEVGGR
jgi:DHA1 family tetracycline resistance protein-like MFS transporter